MLEDKQEILQAIINHQGDCGLFATPGVCKRCPLGNKKIDGRRVNCMDYLNVSPEQGHEEVCDIYEKAAEEELFTISLEEHILED